MSSPIVKKMISDRTSKGRPLASIYYPDYTQYAKKLRVRSESLGEVSRRLFQCSGWRLIPVPRSVRTDIFFQMLSGGFFPVLDPSRFFEGDKLALGADQRIRRYRRDVLGHAPSLAHPTLGRLYRWFGAVGVKVQANPVRRAELVSLYRHTLDFGLVRIGEAHRIFGAAHVSDLVGASRAIQSLPILPFSTAAVALSPIEGLLPATLFVVNSFLELEDQLRNWFD